MFDVLSHLQLTLTNSMLFCLVRLKRNAGNLVVYVAQTVHRFAHHAKCVQRCQTYFLYRIRENSQLRSRDGDFNYTIILYPEAPLHPLFRNKVKKKHQTQTKPGKQIN
jgi:hypothetical protein